LVLFFHWLLESMFGAVSFLDDVKHAVFMLERI